MEVSRLRVMLCALRVEVQRVWSEDNRIYRDG